MAESTALVVAGPKPVSVYFDDFRNTPGWHVAALATAAALGALGMHLSMRGGGSTSGLGFASVKSCRRSKKFERCVKKVKKSSRSVNPWAVCTVSVCR